MDFAWQYFRYCCCLEQPFLTSCVFMSNSPHFTVHTMESSTRQCKAFYDNNFMRFWISLALSPSPPCDFPHREMSLPTVTTVTHNAWLAIGTEVKKDRVFPRRRKGGREDDCSCCMLHSVKCTHTHTDFARGSDDNSDEVVKSSAGAYCVWEFFVPSTLVPRRSGSFPAGTAPTTDRSLTRMETDAVTGAEAAVWWRLAFGTAEPDR